MAWPNDVTEKDLRIEYMRGSGAGGQKMNKTSSACRITHISTGISSRCEAERSQPQNKTRAFEILARKLIPMMRQALETGTITPKPSDLRRVRTYHEPDQRVKDDRLPGKSWTYDSVLEGDGFSEIVDGLLCK